MPKKSIVRLSAQERRTLREIIKQLNGSSQKVRRRGANSRNVQFA